MTDPTPVLLLAFLFLSFFGYVVERNLWHLPPHIRTTARYVRTMTGDLYGLGDALLATAIAAREFDESLQAVEAVIREGEAMVHQALFEQRLRQEQQLSEWIRGGDPDGTEPPYPYF